jgi:putative copper resistance protein D
MPPMTSSGATRDRRATCVASVASAVALAAVASPVAAHGSVPQAAPDAARLLLGWTFAPIPTLALAATAAWWIWAVGRVNSRHPGSPVLRRRTAAFLLGLAALAFALISGIERYDTTLFSVHMVQHVLIVLVAAPLLALSAPVTLLLRVSSRETRRRWLLPILHSRAIRVLPFRSPGSPLPG